MEREDIVKYLKNGNLAIIAKPNSPKTEIIGWDESRNALKINVRARPEDNKANEEIVRFLSKQLKKKVSIKSGFRSKEKLLRIE